MNKETYINTPLPPKTAEKLKRLARANGRRPSREAAMRIIQSVAKAKEPQA